jgi:HD-GYP domain-containing protein (c-di-GMP phosphodiesterase class II)
VLLSEASAVDSTVDLALVAEIGAKLLAATSVADLVILLQRNLKWLLPINSVSLCLPEDNDTHFKVVTTGSDNGRYPMAYSLEGWTLRERAGLDVPDVRDAGYLPPGIDIRALRQAEGALLALPLIVEDQPLGILVIRSLQIGAYARIDRGIVSLLVAQIAAAVRIARLLEELDGAEAAIAGMARAVEAKDLYRHGHAGRVTTYALALCDAAGLPQSVRELIAHAGPLHDIGKIGVPDDIMRKLGRLSAVEFAQIRRHPEIGDEICRPLRSLRRLLPGIRHHHERYDGGGYPDRLAGTAIPVEARVLAIADAYDAMTSTRPYRAGMPHAKAIDILSTNDGPQWDPELVGVFRTLFAPKSSATVA